MSELFPIKFPLKPFSFTDIRLRQVRPPQLNSGADHENVDHDVTQLHFNASFSPLNMSKWLPKIMWKNVLMLSAKGEWMYAQKLEKWKYKSYF